MKNIVVAITGASGTIYGLRLVEELLRSKCRVGLILSNAGREVLNYETGLNWPMPFEQLKAAANDHFAASEQLAIYAENDLFSPLASGSSCAAAMVVIPCSMGTLGRIAGGLSNNLIERAADVALKERRELLLVPRETPFNQIHLENLLRLSRAGAQIIPAMPGFYHRPQNIDDLVNFVVGKVLDALGVEHQLFLRWGAAK